MNLSAKSLILLHIIVNLSIALGLSTLHWALGAGYAVAVAAAAWWQRAAIREGLLLYSDIQTDIHKTRGVSIRYSDSDFTAWAAGQLDDADLKSRSQRKC